MVYWTSTSWPYDSFHVMVSDPGINCVCKSLSQLVLMRFGVICTYWDRSLDSTVNVVLV